MGCGCEPRTLPFPDTMPAGNPIIGRFDGGSLSSDDGLLALGDVEARLGVAERLAACIDDPRAPGRVCRARGSPPGEAHPDLDR